MISDDDVVYQLPSKMKLIVSISLLEAGLGSGHNE